MKRLHHELNVGTSIRRCCFECYLRDDSNYRRVYDNRELERVEVERVRDRIANWSCVDCHVYLTNQEILDSGEFYENLACPRCKRDLKVHGDP